MKKVTLAVIGINPRIDKVSREITGYVILTEQTKDNPYTNGNIKLSAAHADNLASKSPAGTIDRLTTLAAFGDTLVSVETNGSHKAGDHVMDSEGNKILVPVNERNGVQCDDEGYRVHAKDGANIDNYSLEVQIGEIGLSELVLAQTALAARNARRKTAKRNVEVEAQPTPEKEQIGATAETEE